MWGLDYLGGAKFQDALINAHPKGWAAGFFLNTFGDAWPTVIKLAATGKAPVIRVHAIYEGNHLYSGSKHDPIIKQEAEKCAKVQKQFPSVIFQFSPFCEHTMTKFQFKAVVGMLKSYGLMVVNNPMKFMQIKDMINECHLSKKPMEGKYNFSLDGDSAVDCDIEEYKSIHKSAGIFFFWNCQFNGRRNDNDTTAIPLRKFYPDESLIRSIAYLSNDKQKTNLKLPYTWKSHAEDSGDGRANEPLLLAPETVSNVDLLLDDGSVLATAPKYPKPYVDGRQRYYFSMAKGFELANKAIKRQGHPVCKIRIADKIVGKVNPAFRDGSYH